MWSRVRRLVAEEGATAAEYALMVGLIALVILAAATALGTAVLGLFERVPQF